jgi:hypothetical protein
MQAAKNWCDGERVKKLGILMSSKQGLTHDTRNGARNVLVHIKGCLVWVLKFNKYCSTLVLFDKKFSILD